VVATVESKSYQTTDGQIVKIEKMPFGSDLRLNSYKETFRFLPWEISDRRFFCPDILSALQDKSRPVPNDRQIKEFVFLTDILGQNIKEDPLDYRSRSFWETCILFGLDRQLEIRPGGINFAGRDKNCAQRPGGYWNLAQAKLFEMRINEALSLAQKALAMEPDHPKSRELIYKIEDIIKKIGDNPPSATSGS